MKRTLLLLLTGTLSGALLTAFWLGSVNDKEQARQRQENESRLAQLQQELTASRATAGEWKQRFESAGLAEGPAKENVLDIQRLLNDARPLLKTLSLMFSDRRKAMSDRMIRSMAGKLAEKMQLTDEQTEAMIAHFIKLDGENFEKLKAILDRPLTILDVFTVMNDMNPQRAMDSYVRQTMTPEQKAAWENRKLETKAQQLERTANWQLDRMNRTLNLDEAQQDQVFKILVKTNPEYDPSLAVEGVPGATEDNAVPLPQDEAIASILRPDQMENWSAWQERQKAEKERLSNALGGFDPTTFFRSMSGGMGGFGGQGRGAR